MKQYSMNVTKLTGFCRTVILKKSYETEEPALRNREISKAVISRLPRYYRYLGDLLNSGIERISSGELSRLMKVTASQIRQDLNNFGGFGQQGYGYNVRHLRDEIGKILGLEQNHSMIIVGTGHLGKALANYENFNRGSIHIVGLFDVREEVIGTKVKQILVRSVEELPAFLSENNVEIAVLTLPKNNAKEIARVLVANGIRAIWNFAYTDLNLELPDDVIVENVHLSDSLMQLTYRLHAEETTENEE